MRKVTQKREKVEDETGEKIRAGNKNPLKIARPPR
jgi:hypothetical protein